MVLTLRQSYLKDGRDGCKQGYSVVRTLAFFPEYFKPSRIAVPQGMTAYDWFLGRTASTKWFLLEACNRPNSRLRSPCSQTFQPVNKNTAPQRRKSSAPLMLRSTRHCAPMSEQIVARLSVVRGAHYLGYLAWVYNGASRS